MSSQILLVDFLLFGHDAKFQYLLDRSSILYKGQNIFQVLFLIYSFFFW